MTERIKELKREAEALAYEEHKANCIKNGRDPSMPHANALNMTFEKFAELIVRECARRCEDIAIKHQVEETTYAAGKKAGAFECAKDLKQHFGVEE